MDRNINASLNIMYLWTKQEAMRNGKIFDEPIHSRQSGAFVKRQ